MNELFYLICDFCFTLTVSINESTSDDNLYSSSNLIRLCEKHKQSDEQTGFKQLPDNRINIEDKDILQSTSTLTYCTVSFFARTHFYCAMGVHNLHLAVLTFIFLNCLDHLAKLCKCLFNSNLNKDKKTSNAMIDHLI